jgi:heme/copper-type cytochrome/quinol oxidase subunit 3
MSGPNVIPLRAHRAVQQPGVDPWVLAALAQVAIAGTMLAGVVSAFLLTRAVAGADWPPAGQPWFPPGETAVNTAALLASGGLAFRTARLSRDPAARIGPTLLATITLGAFFLFFQGVVWVGLTREGLDLTASHHGKFFCLIVAMHAAQALGALILLGIVWLRLGPLRDDESPRPLGGNALRAACIPWYFAVAAWPVLYLCLYR